MTTDNWKDNLSKFMRKNRNSLGSINDSITKSLEDFIEQLLLAQRAELGKEHEILINTILATKKEESLVVVDSDISTDSSLFDRMNKNLKKHHAQQIAEAEVRAVEGTVEKARSKSFVADDERVVKMTTLAKILAEFKKRKEKR